MSELLETFKDTAKKILEHDKFVAPVVFFIKEGTVIQMVSIDQLARSIIPKELKIGSSDYKHLCYVSIGIFANCIGAEKVIIIIDAAMREGPVPPEELDDTELPLSYPKSMRTECIVILEIDLKMEKDDVRIVPYKGGDGEPVEFIDRDFSNMEGMKSAFTHYILKGYNGGNIPEIDIKGL
jgi:hypothetical protein